MDLDRTTFEPDDVDTPEPTDGVVPWQDPAWLAEAGAWISGACDAAGLERTGPGLLRGRMWSAVARIPVVGGDVWFKQNAPRGGFEPALLAALARWRPQDESPLIAVDTDRRWSLNHDVGERLDGLLKRDPDVRHLHTPLRRYARLQRELAAHAEELLAIGVPDGRPEHIEEMLDDVLGCAPSGLIDDAVLRHVEAKRPELRAHAQELAAFGVPATIDHQDLHPGNILGDGVDSRLFDWGDSTIGCPFGSILVVLRALPAFAPVDRADPEVKLLREVYLEPWRADDALGLSDAELRRAVELALQLTMVMRAHTWTRTLPSFRRSPQPWSQVATWLGRIGCEDPVTVGL